MVKPRIDANQMHLLGIKKINDDKMVTFPKKKKKKIDDKMVGLFNCRTLLGPKSHTSLVERARVHDLHPPYNLGPGHQMTSDFFY